MHTECLTRLFLDWFYYLTPLWLSLFFFFIGTGLLIVADVAGGKLFNKRIRAGYGFRGLSALMLIIFVISIVFFEDVLQWLSKCADYVSG